mmetsp:Transcript_12095/g.30515  ORF Transcript_12095/g.30515 Transcript_12095/m.30515 type:complete len:211 (-) Transcript_12095:254-886(-)
MQRERYRLKKERHADNAGGALHDGPEVMLKRGLTGTWHIKVREKNDVVDRAELGRLFQDTACFVFMPIRERWDHDQRRCVPKSVSQSIRVRRVEMHHRNVAHREEASRNVARLFGRGANGSALRCRGAYCVDDMSAQGGIGGGYDDCPGLRNGGREAGAHGTAEEWVAETAMGGGWSDGNGERIRECWRVGKPSMLRKGCCRIKTGEGLS